MATETMVPPTDPKAIREKVEAWHKTHKERYDAFKKQAEGVGNLDFSFFMKLMQFATDCIPQDRLEVCSYIFRLYCADIPLEKETPEFIKQYDPIVAEFLQGGKVPPSCCDATWMTSMPSWMMRASLQMNMVT